MFTVEQAANMLGVSKVTVYAKLKKYPTMVVTKQGKKLITEDLFNLIKSELKHNDDVNSEVKSGENEAAATIENTEDKELNKVLIDALLKELDEKNKQIESLQELLKAAQKLNENSQVLLKNTQGTDPLQLQEHIEARKEEQHKTFFSRFRKKH